MPRPKQLGRPLGTTLIGLLSSKEDPRRHDELVILLERLCTDRRYSEVLSRYSFVMTGGTYNRLIDPDPKRDPEVKVKGSKRDGVNEVTKEFLLDKCGILKLPHHRDGGVILLAYLVVQRRVGIFWQFLTPINPHWILPENVALMRLCDYWHVNRLLNPHAVEKWVKDRAFVDAEWNRQDLPLEGLEIESLKKSLKKDEKSHIIEFKDAADPLWMFDLPRPRGGEGKERSNIPRVDYHQPRRAALIAHDEMKERMVDFAVDYERELESLFDKIITTGTTGARIQDAAPKLRKKIHAYLSGPKGGDIQIATEIMLGLIDVVIFFVDPLHPHAHTDDIRVVFSASMMHDVEMLTNERQARQWLAGEVLFARQPTPTNPTSKKKSTRRSAASK